jgi:hypothetical protein
MMQELTGGDAALRTEFVLQNLMLLTLYLTYDCHTAQATTVRWSPALRLPPESRPLGGAAAQGARNTAVQSPLALPTSATAASHRCNRMW